MFRMNLGKSIDSKKIAVAVLVGVTLVTSVGNTKSVHAASVSHSGWTNWGWPWGGSKQAQCSTNGNGNWVKSIAYVGNGKGRNDSGYSSGVTGVSSEWVSRDAGVTRTYWSY